MGLSAQVQVKKLQPESSTLHVVQFGFVVQIASASGTVKMFDKLQRSKSMPVTLEKMYLRMRSLLFIF
jgi:hypothetical protein